MVTGLDLKRLFEDKIDNSYSDYVSDPKMQRAFDNAFLRVIENKYRGLDTQKEFDELSELMVIDRNIIVNNNRFRTKPIPLASVTGTTFTFSAEHNLIAGDTFTVQETGTANDGLTFTVASITTVSVVETTVVGVPVTQNMGSVISEDVMLEDYLHLLAMKIDMYSVLTKMTPILCIRYTLEHLLLSSSLDPQTSEALTGCHGIILNNPSGTAYVKQISEFKYEIYSDKDLLVPFTVLNAPSTLPTVRASKVHSNWAKYLQSDRRISSLVSQLLTSQGSIRIKTSFLFIRNKITFSVSVDYIRKPEYNHMLLTIPSTYRYSTARRY
jgi:hypothetical protein